MPSVSPSGDPMVGRTIAQYEVLARVGGGGMGVVYRAKDTRLGRVVALKFLPQQWSHDETARQRFVREAQAASATNHPNICTVHDIQTADDGQLFIVMAYYEGQTLKQRLEGGPLPIDEALDIATQVADGLAKAHTQGIVHRDVKPGNVILTEEGARIVDFGLATFADALKLTIEHSTLGTAAYMSPEQVRGDSADARSDVWAVGVMLYEMVAGHVPFQGSHSEAIAYAVRNETPRPLRRARPEIPEEVEQLVFRAMHKEASVRYASGRDLARALRQVRGLTIPVTEPIAVQRPLPARSQEDRSRLRRWRGALVTCLIGLAPLTWILWPIERTPIVVVPVVNLTGYADLNALRQGLTHALGVALADSRVVRVVGHEQLSSILIGIRRRGKDISSGEAIQAIRGNTNARALIVVSFQNANDRPGFHARVEVLDVATLTAQGAAFETAPEVSAIVTETAYRLITPVAQAIEEHFRNAAPLRAAMNHGLYRTLGRQPSPVLPVGNVGAAAAFEQGLEAYEELEYISARQFFDDAAQRDPLNPLLVAWQSRAARVARRDVEAERLARQAVALLSDETPPRERLFVEAVAAESRGDIVVAETRYVALRDLSPADPSLLLELAAFQDRRGSNSEAIESYHRALDRDDRLVRPHLELCRLYNRVHQPVEARNYGRRAVERYRTLGADGKHAQALFCLTDSLQMGDLRERDEALTHATSALQLVQNLKHPYNLSRAYNYVALALHAQGRLDEAARMWEQALSTARNAGNVVLQPLVLMNLGSTYEHLGNRSKAIDFLRQSTSGFEALGEQSRAAESLFNVGVMLIEYGGDPAEGSRNIADALEVFRESENRKFEVVAAQAMSTYYRYAGRYKDAERELEKARSLAGERDLDARSATTSIRLAQTLLGTGDYDGARRLLVSTLEQASDRRRIEAQIYLAKAHGRLGEFAQAWQVLGDVRHRLGENHDAGLLPLLNAVSGELAFEEGKQRDARKYFTEAAAFLTTELLDVDALEARAYVGLLDAHDGRLDRGLSILRESLEAARRIGHVSLQTRCLMFLAQIDISRGRFDQALKALAEVPDDDDRRAIERELRAYVHYWTGRALSGVGSSARASSEHAAAREVVRGLSTTFESPRKEIFLSRRLIAEILQ